MNNNAPSDPTIRRSDQEGSSLQAQGATGKTEEFNLGEIFANLWEGRRVILGSITLFLVLGLIYAYSSASVYQVEGLLQTETQKTYGNQPGDFNKMEGLYSLPTVAQGEIEILKSNLILGKVVEALNLDVVCSPVLKPYIGKFLARDKSKLPKAEIEAFVLPDRLRGLFFKVELLPGGAYVLKAPDGTPLVQGRPGDRISAQYQGNPIQLKIRSLRGSPGQALSLALNPMLDAINDLRLSLQVEERGKNAMVSSNILYLGLQYPDPEQGAVVLNEVLNQYLRQTIERKAGESSKALELLERQRPVLQAQLAAAETRLNEYRRASGAMDVVKEGELYLQQSSALDAQISTLQQRREDLLRTYTEKSDLVTTIDQQIAQLRKENSRVDARVSSLPQTQQEVVRLSRDVQVKSEMYTSLLASIQQLQTTLAGSVGNARVVDYAIPNYDPIAPKKKILLILFLFLGTTVGVGITVIRRLLRRGIEDHRLIEGKLGLPVLVTIPHSDAQEEQSLALHKREPGHHLLTVHAPEDLASESIRSLRTVLHFTLEDIANRVILVTGPSPRIGKSFVSANLAAVLAQAGANVLVVDADLRKGGLHLMYGAKRRGLGLSEIIRGRADWKDVALSTDVPGLSFISTGTLPQDPLVLFMSPQFTQFVTEVNAAFDVVLFDAPPLLPVSDAIVLGARVDTILMVAKYATHSMDELRTSMDRLKSHRDKLKGCIFNDIKLVGVAGLYGYYKYDFDYTYRRGDA